MWRLSGVMGLALAAALLGGAAQAKSPAKQSKPARLQGAPCTAQFARDNAVKPEAGPYRMHLTETLMPNEGTASTREKLVEVVSPQAYRVRGVGDIDYTDIVVHGAQGWIQLPQGWVKLPEDLPALGDDAQYVDVGDAAVRCMAHATYQGQAVRAYRWQMRFREDGWDAVFRRQFQVSADSGLPVFSSVEVNMARQPGKPGSGGRKLNTARYEFDRSIQIPQPEALAP